MENLQRVEQAWEVWTREPVSEARYERGLLTVVLPVAARKSGPTRIAVTRSRG